MKKPGFKVCFSQMQTCTAYAEKNRRDVEEKSEQLKSISNLSALLAGFAVVAFVELQVGLGQNTVQLMTPSTVPAWST